MATSFDRWEKDPFFAAAEEVQESSDRLRFDLLVFIFSHFFYFVLMLEKLGTDFEVFVDLSIVGWNRFIGDGSRRKLSAKIRMKVLIRILDLLM